MLSYKTIIIFSAVCFFLTIIFGFVAYQAIFEFVIKDQVSLHHKNYVRQFYLKYPIALDFKVYFFNVTNPVEVHNGGTPVLKEIGPFCYDLYKERINVDDNETEDSLTYTPYDTYLFNQERSGPLSQDDYVTIIHPFIVGMINHVVTNSPQFVTILNNALGNMFNNTSIFLTAKVKDILFDGMPINCTTNDFTTMAVCSKLKTSVPGLKPDGKDNFKFALLGQRNGTVPIRMKVLRGIQNSKDLGRLIAVDNRTKDNYWYNESCNEYQGTDGWIFPPLLKSEHQIWIHSTDLCTNIHADFVEDTVSHDLTVRKFYSDFDNICDNCSSPEDSCPLRGLLDLTKCLKVPIYISLPHFLRSDEKLRKDVIGMEPVTEKHITRILLDGTLSLPLEAQIRAQFNFRIQPVDKITIMKTVPELVHPVLWIEMGVDLDGWILRLIKAIFYSLTAIEILKYVFLVCSLLGVGIGTYFYRKNRKVYKANNNIVLQSK